MKGTAQYPPRGRLWRDRESPLPSVDSGEMSGPNIYHPLLPPCSGYGEELYIDQPQMNLDIFMTRRHKFTKANQSSIWYGTTLSIDGEIWNLAGMSNHDCALMLVQFSLEVWKESAVKICELWFCIFMDPIHYFEIEQFDLALKTTSEAPWIRLCIHTICDLTTVCKITWKLMNACQHEVGIWW